MQRYKDLDTKWEINSRQKMVLKKITAQLAMFLFSHFEQYTLP